MEQLASVIATEVRPGHVVRVAVDGVDGAGKTVFADELAVAMRQRGKAVLRASVDGFHHPPELRYRRGRSSPDGFFLDSYDYPALRRLLLDPLGDEGDRRIVRRVYDVHAEEPVEEVVESAADTDVLVFDGIFLHRPELRDVWDLSVFLEADFEFSIPRGARRGYGDPDVAAASNRRYIEGQRRYLDSCQPHLHATWVVNNDVLADAHIKGAPDT
ncbi:MAG: uridine kinase [Nitriliruptor sp.]|nr:MAG: uridine kinase [Nitriliruptor sp.]